jgi:hypothetical protein
MRRPSARQPRASGASQPGACPATTEVRAQDQSCGLRCNQCGPEASARINDYGRGELSFRAVSTELGLSVRELYDLN